MSEILEFKNGRYVRKFPRVALNKRLRSDSFPSLSEEVQRVPSAVDRYVANSSPKDRLFGSPVQRLNDLLGGTEDNQAYPYPIDNPTAVPIPKMLERFDDVGIDDLGTLMPPRPLEQPWRTAAQQLFRAGDMVVWRTTDEVGQINAVFGEEAVVFFGKARYRIPIQELVLYNGSVRTLKLNSDYDGTPALLKKVRRQDDLARR